MKINVSSLRQSGPDILPRCSQLVEHISSAPSEDIFFARLTEVHEWQPQFGKSEMARWAGILNACDKVLERAASRVDQGSQLAVDADISLVPRVSTILSFTALLFENTFSRSIYSSSEHLLELLDSGNMEVVVDTLRLLLVMSKRSRFLSQHLTESQQKQLALRLTAIAQCWGGKLRSMKMDECCKSDVRSSSLLPIAFQTSHNTRVVRGVKLEKSFAAELDDLLAGATVKDEERVGFAARLRLVRAFLSSPKDRCLCVMARLLAVSIIVYSRNLLEEWQMNSMLYDGFIEETAQLLLAELPSDNVFIDSIRTEALKTLTSVVSLDRPAKLSVVVDCLGANSYHGFMAQMARACVSDLRVGKVGQPGATSVQFCTALFSLLYHLAGFDSGGEALVSCALTETLLSVVSCEHLSIEHVSFVTRAVRVVDIMTSLDANAFTSCNGMNIIVQRLIFEVQECAEQLSVTSCGPVEPCHQQRAALIKSLLNFIKRAIQDSQFADGVSHIMDGGLPGALIQIISRCDYFGASLFHNAICLVTNFIYQEPSLLTSIQDKGVTDAILQAVFHKELPASRDAISSLPNTFTALCLNERGLRAFTAEEPFDHMCRIILSTKFITAMKRRRNEMNDVLSLGPSLEDLLRHQPSLRSQLLNSLVKMLDRLVAMPRGSNPPRCIMWLAECRSSGGATPPSSAGTAAAPDGSSQDEDRAMPGNDSSDDEDDDPSSTRNNMEELPVAHESLGLSESVQVDGCTVTPLGEHLFNVGRLFETMLTQNASTENAEAFIECGVVDRLITLLYQPQLPFEIAQSFFPQMVSSIIRSLFQQTRSDKVISCVGKELRVQCETLMQMSKTLSTDDVEQCYQSTIYHVRDALPVICAISSLCGVLANLSKTALNTTAVMRTSVLKFWTDGHFCDGILSVLNIAHRILSWEAAVVQEHNATIKVTTGSQTENEENTSEKPSEPVRYEESDWENEEDSPEKARERTPYVETDCVYREVYEPKPERFFFPKESWMNAKTTSAVIHRCVRQISDLLGVLAKVCIGGSSRGRRPHEAGTSAPCKNAVQLGRRIFKGFCNAFEFATRENNDWGVALVYLTNWISSLSSVLFDERRQPYHVLLSAFYFSHSHDTFFSLVKHFCDHGKLDKMLIYSLQLEQFLVTWMSLTERLVNAHGLLHSRHRLSDQCPDSQNFVAEKYLTFTQHDALREIEHILKLLNTPAIETSPIASVSACELALSVLKELVKGLIHQFAENEKAAEVASAAEERKKLAAKLEEGNIELLVDMGFERDMAIDALLEFSTVPEAAEYLIGTDRPVPPQSQTGEAPVAPKSGEQMSTDASTVSGQMSEAERCSVSLRAIAPVDCNHFFNEVLYNALTGCFRMMRHGVQIVFSTSELMLAVLDELPNFPGIITIARLFLIEDVVKYSERMFGRDGASGVLTEKGTSKLAARLHLTCLLWTSLSDTLLEASATYNLPQLLVAMIDRPKLEPFHQSLVAPVCLWLDLYGKMLHRKHSKQKMEKVVDTLVWKYWDPDERTGLISWYNYPPASSHQLTRAYYDGRKGTLLTVGGRHYYVNFTTMTQRNVDTHVERPITVEARLKTVPDAYSVLRFPPDEEMREWDKFVSASLVPILIKLFSTPGLDANAVHAALILAARVTLDDKAALEMVKGGGISALLNIEGSPHALSALLFALVVRHCLDNEASIAQIFELTIRTVAVGGYTPFPTSRWHHTGRAIRATRDWLHAMRALAPLCARSPFVFIDTMKRIARKQKGLISVVPMTGSADSLASRPPYYVFQFLERMVHLLMMSILGADENSNRIISRAALLRLLAELVKTYTAFATLVTESQKAVVAEGGQPVLVSILDRCLVSNTGGQSSTTGELSLAVKSLVSALASCNHSPKAQEALITGIVACLHLAFNECSPTILNMKVKALADLVVLARDSCTLPSQESRSGTSSSSPSSPIVRLLLKKRVFIELAKVPWHLNLSTKEGTDTLNHVLRILEDLTRSVNSTTHASAVDSSSSQNASTSVTISTAASNDVAMNVSSTGIESSSRAAQPTTSRTVDDQSFATSQPSEENMVEDEFDHPVESETRNETEEESSDTEGDDDGEDEDDDQGGNEMDMGGESDEEEDERDDEAVMEEEGRGSEEEDEDDEFGLVEMEDEPGRRFEDGDPDDSLVNANIFLENLDDVSQPFTTSTFGSSRLFVQTGLEPTRSERTLSSTTSMHPLMQRPSVTHSESSTTTQRPTQGYRLMIGSRRSAGAVAPGLHRQGAVRRWGTLGQHNEIIERLMEGGPVDNAAVTNIFDVIHPRARLFNVLFLQESTAEGSAVVGNEDRSNMAVPSPLERFVDAARLIDEHPFSYTWVVAAEIITSALDGIEKKETEEKEKLEAAKKAEEEESAAKEASAKDGLTAEDAAAAAPSAVEHEAEGAVSSSPVDAQDLIAENGNAEAVPDSQPFLVQGDAEEPMDTSDADAVAVFFDAQDDSTQALSRDSASADANPESSGSSTVASMRTALSTLSCANESDQQGSSTQEGGMAEASALASPDAADEYRDILGDIEIPEGVDPAFLAALPEDIRAEVIRDQIRQQRTERLTQQSAGAAAGSSMEGAVGGTSGGVEPLDQEFLNALPPDLQEEILAQHERTLRLANERVENANTGGPSSSSHVNDAAALIESLSPSLRAQVLADADDTVLQVLPQNVAAEARRLRATFEQQQVMRFARMLAPGRFRQFARGGGAASGSALVGALAGATTVASKSATQLLDRDAIVTLIILLFVDPARLNTQRLQKLIKSVCAHSATCDFVIWCLIALLDRLNMSETRYEDFVGTASGWIDHICVPSGLGQRERAIKFYRNTHSVAIHPAVAVTVTRLVLESLTSLAKAYPGHFLPSKLRSSELPANTAHSHPLTHFWHVVHSLSRADAISRGVVHRHSSSGQEGSNILSGIHASLATSSLEESAVGVLMLHLNRPVVRCSSQLQDKLLRLICTIVQTLPDDTASKLALEESPRPPLWTQLENVVEVLTEGECSEEGLSDGRTLLMEAIRSLTVSTRAYLHNLFICAAERLGNRLLPQITELHKQLSSVLHDETTSVPSSSAIELHPSRVVSNRYDSSAVVIEGVANSRAVLNASVCPELQLPAVKVLTEKHGVQNVFLRTLHTIIKMREILKSNLKKKTEGSTEEPSPPKEEERMSLLLQSLDPLWDMVSQCLILLAQADSHAALALQPAAEAFFLVHASSLSLVDPNKPIDHPDALKLIQFAEKHRGVLNQVLRQSGCKLSDGPFSILIQMPKMLDFDVKRKFFRKQIQRLDVRGEDVAVRVRRSHLFSDSFRELFRLRGPDWKSRFYIIFEGEEGQDAGGLLREWFSIITREIFNPNYALFITAPGDRVTYMINKTSYINPEHLEYFKFVGRIIAKAVYENKLLDCYFTRAFYKHILNLPVKAQDLESEDPSFYKSLEFLLSHPIEELGTELTFSVEVEEFGVRKMRQLKDDGAAIPVTDENKEEYVKLVCQMKMTGSINQQLSAFLEGFYEIIPKNLISMFNEQELELLISGLPDVDIDDLYANTEYKTYTKASSQIQWFWKALRSFEQEDRAKFLQFVTGTSKVPLQGFAALEGMNGVQKFSIHMDSRSPDRLPAAHTCFNQLDLPQYESYEKLRQMLLLAVRECTEGFGFA